MSSIVENQKLVDDSALISEEKMSLRYYVVKNIEEQYSIFPSNREIPNGWSAVGEAKVKKDALAYIKEVWTDMRPLSVRNSEYS